MRFLFSKLKKKNDKFKAKGPISRPKMGLFAAAFAVVGVAALVSSFAATAVSIDSSIPVPTKVKAYGDNQSIIITWSGQNSPSVVGYYITYRIKGSNSEYTVRQQEKINTAFGESPNAIQLQPLINGVTYEINIQSATGNYQSFPAGGIAYGSQNTRYAVGNGNVSPAVTVEATPSSARVDAMREKYTGFFDDFDYGAGPFDELKWNNASNGCNAPGKAAAFVNGQYHAHNVVKSYGQCDRAGMATRPRAVFDMTGASPSNPAEAAIDIDGVTHNRDTWYLDFIPMDARSNGLPVDITSHNDIDDEDTFGPGNMVRLNVRQSAYSIVYYDENFNPRKLDLFNGDVVCGPTFQGRTVVRFNSCDLSRKTPGISPLAEPTDIRDNIANVRRNWVVRFDGSKINVYLDSAFIGSANLPAAFNQENKFQVHSTVFSYNTGKDTEEQQGGPVPTVELLHWDNLGFTGPASDTVVHNYLEGQETGDKPVYSIGTSEGEITRGNRTSIVPIPDEIGNTINNKADLFFTVQQLGFYGYTWSPNDHVLINGTRYDVPSPRENAGASAQLNEVSFSTLYAFAMEVDSSVLTTGDNEVQFVLNGDPAGFRNNQADVFNVHIELEYDKNGAVPDYTQPLGVFGEQFRGIVEPAITNCDYYRVIERDLGLPYQAGRSNLDIGTCVLLEPAASQHGSSTPAPGDPDAVCEDSTATNTGALLPCEYPDPTPDPDPDPTPDPTPPELPEPNPANADWIDADIGSSQPQINIVETFYPDSNGVQFYVNGSPDNRDNNARPNGFDATGPRENSEYHIYPTITLSEGDELEARWTDTTGTVHRNVVTVSAVTDPDPTPDPDPDPTPDPTPPELPEPNPANAGWENATVGTSQPQVNISDSVYPNSLGVQFLVNGSPDARHNARPNGFDATGPRENSQYHIYPDITLSEEDVLEARWTDTEGVVHRNVITISSTAPASEPTPTALPTARFETLPVNADLPSGAECAVRVRPAVEIRPANTPYNQTVGEGSSYFYPRVDGNYTGTTDEIIQWTACKHGIDEDLLRAQMVQESFWHQSAIGDFTSNDDSEFCSNVYPTANYPAQFDGDSEHNNQCPESYGLSQVRWSYHESAFYSSATENGDTLTNNAIYSTAFNMDYYGAFWRSCFNGEMGWLNTVERGDVYSAGDAEGCQGVWFSGRWKTARALEYMDNVQNNLSGRVWESGAFISATPANTIPPKSTPAPEVPEPVCEDNTASNTGGSLPCEYPEPDTPPETDTQNPSATLASPANGMTTSGEALLVNVLASDNVGVTRVVMYLDNEQVATEFVAPYNYVLNTSTLDTGQHTVYAIAFDEAGNTTQTSTATINVPEPLIPGDINGDGRISVNDVRILINNYGRNNVSRSEGDLDGDGRVSVNDVRILINNLRN